MAAASYVLVEYPRAIDELEHAYAAYRRVGNGAGAARMARTLAYLYGSTAGDWAVASGWLSRAKTLLEDAPESSERGWIALTEGMFADHRRVKEEAFRTALEVGRSTGDADLTYATMSYLGASLVHEDRLDEGMAMLDEALAAVAGGDVDEFVVLEEIFCQLFSACEHTRDVRRAEQWIRVGEQIATRRNLPAVSAYCRTHYGGILTAAGRWPEADVALTEAVRLWALGRRTLKAGALIRLADLRVRQGRYDEAASLLEGLEDPDARRVRATLHLARGETPPRPRPAAACGAEPRSGEQLVHPAARRAGRRPAGLRPGHPPDDRAARGVRRGAPLAVRERRPGAGQGAIGDG